MEGGSLPFRENLRLKPISQLQDEQKTHLILSSLTELANPTNDSRLKCDPLTQFQLPSLGDIRTKLDNDSRRFMAKAHGFLKDERPNLSMLQVMDIGSTDTGLLDLDQDLVGTDLGDGPLVVSSRQRNVVDLRSRF